MKMNLIIENEQIALKPIDAVRAACGLPPSFGMALFAPSDTAHHSFWVAHHSEVVAMLPQLATVVPSSLTPERITAVPQLIATLFEQELVLLAAGTDVTREEIELTATILRDGLEPAAYKLVELFYLHGKDKTAVRQLFEATAVYDDLLNSSVMLSWEGTPYEHEGETWHIRLIHTLYGLVGLEAITPTETIYMLDEVYAFPLYEVLAEMITAVAEAMCASFTA